MTDGEHKILLSFYLLIRAKFS